jgi:hypothetical protein
MLISPAFAKRSPTACSATVTVACYSLSRSRLTTGCTWRPSSLIFSVREHSSGASVRRPGAGAPSDVLPIPRPPRPAYRGWETRTSPVAAVSGPGPVAGLSQGAARPWLETRFGWTASITGIARRAVILAGPAIGAVSRRRPPVTASLPDHFRGPAAHVPPRSDSRPQVA